MNNKTNRLILHVAKKYLLVFSLLLLTQVLFYLANTRLFHLEGFREFLTILWGNIRFGTASTALFLAPYLIMMLLPIEARWNKRYRTIAEVFFWIGALILLLVNIVDMAYYQFTYRRMSAMMFRYMSVGGDMGNLIPKFLVDYWYATVSAVVVVSILIASCLHIRLRNIEGWSKNQSSSSTLADRRSRRKENIRSIVGILVVLILIRGGIGRQNLQSGEVVRYAQPKNSALIMNSAYNIVRTIGNLDIEEQHFMSPVAAQKLYPTLHNPLPPALRGAIPYDATGNLFVNNPEWMMEIVKNTTSYDSSLNSIIQKAIDSINNLEQKQRNVVIIILEGFSQEYMGCYNQGIMPSYTPFLDELSKQSACYQGRSNGKESIESIPAILSSIPSWSLSPFILSPYYKRDSISSLASLLKPHGYRSAMFHGGYNGSMNFDQFCRKAGFDHYFGMNEYVAIYGEDAYDGAWGIFDEPFMQYAIEEMNVLPQPFFSSIYTISAHHPYGLPEGYVNKAPDGKHPILPTVTYSDHAVKRFFEEAQKQPWYENTLFVILADHPGPSLHREYNDYVGWYRIPMMFFDPSNTSHATMSNDIVQQIDVMPTLLDMLKVDAPAVCFGNSLLRRDKKDHGYQIVFGNDFYQLERNGEVTLYSPYKTIGREEDLEFLKAAIQVYNSKLINNQLTR